MSSEARAQNPYQRIFNEEITLDLIKIGAEQRMARGLFNVKVGLAEHVLGDYLGAQITAYVYGKNGNPARVERTIIEARFPRWMPGWLCKRWSRRRHITLDAQPFLVWPDATVVPPEFGNPVRLVRHSRSES